MTGSYDRIILPAACELYVRNAANNKQHAKRLPTGGLLQIPNLKPSEFQCTMRRFGFKRMTLRFMSAMLIFPRMRRQQARYVDLRGSTFIS